MSQNTLDRQSLLTEQVAHDQNQTADPPETLPDNNSPQKIRIQSLDVYRGLTMVGMILVDNMGPVSNPPWFLDHAMWNGVTPADFIFPAFLFIMGMAIPLAVSPKRPVRIRNLLRIAGLFLIGFFLNLLAKKFNFQEVRILGILQRLSICYAVILLTHVVTRYGQKHLRIVASIFMLGLYSTYLISMLQFQGAGKAGCSKDNNLTDKCNFAGHVDHLILTDHHCWKGGYTDPEGVFSTIGAILTTYMGYVFSLIMGQYKERPSKMVLYWFLISAIFGALVYPMTLLMPLNKKLYSASFTLIVVAVSGASLIFFYFLVDVLPSLKPSSKRIIEILTGPLKWLGLNPLAIFFLMDVLAIIMIIYIKIDDRSIWSWFYKKVFGSWIQNQQVGATVFACFFLLLWTAVAGIMHRFKVYVRL